MVSHNEQLNQYNKMGGGKARKQSTYKDVNGTSSLVHCWRIISTNEGKICFNFVWNLNRNFRSYESCDCVDCKNVKKAVIFSQKHEDE